ncbi:MAG TPA: prepilin peptidase [Oscillatoriales cyanobacterium M59_W2019_021]|nr:MAG: prepilin peptidase [Cyanobacteria bacterium J055]HIK49760.1 prepilin peptidase [Oscillatoriales cyanobacterium M59_W2019_021]
MDFLLALPAAMVVFLLGAAIGSFLNVVVYRLPAGLSLLWPPSRCPQCLHPLKKRENVPVLGWLWLKGRCSHCRSPIPIRYPLVEAATGLLFVLVFLVCGWSSLTWGYWLLLSELLALSLIDADTMTLPNELTQSGLVAGLVFQGVLGWQTGGEPSAAIAFLMKGIVGAVLGIWLLDIISLVGSIALGQTAMGAGDGKLMALIGAWLGWKLMLLAGFLGCAMGAFAGGGAIALGWLHRRQPMPFGPFLALGAAIAALWGDAIISLYLQLFFPVA